MARTVSDDVIEIMTNEVPSGADLTAFINIAYSLISDNLDDTVLSESCLTNIEMYLAAHFAALKYKHTTAMEIGGSNRAKETYGYKLDKGLELTVYGQTAIMLDTTGKLKKINSSKLKFDVAIFEADREWNNI